MTKPELAQWAKEDGTGRAYKHPFRTVTVAGKEVPLTSPSVTTVLGLVDKPALIQWAADRTLDWAIENASLLFVKDEEGARRWGRYRWTDVRDERAEVGTGIHETIEMEHTGGWNYPVLDDEQMRIMEQWRLLNQRYLIVPHRSEFTVWGGLTVPNGDWAGTGDGLWDITDLETGQTWVGVFIDLKTSRNTWPEHWLQLSALRHADVIMVKQDDGTWTETPLSDLEGDFATAIIHLREDKWNVTIEDDRTLLDAQYDQFMAYRQVWHTKKVVEDYIRDRAKTKEMAF